MNRGFTAFLMLVTLLSVAAVGVLYTFGVEERDRLSNRISSLANEVEAQKQAVQTPEGEVAEVAAGADENQPGQAEAAASAHDISLLTNRINAAHRKIDELQEATANGSDEDVAALEERVAALEAAIERLTQRIEEVGASGNASNEDEEVQAPLTAEEITVAFSDLAKNEIGAYGTPEWRALVKKLETQDRTVVVPVLAGKLANGSVFERFAAAAVMEGLGWEENIPHLSSALQRDQDPLVRRMSSHALAFTDSPNVVPALEQALANDAEEGVRVNSAFGLAKQEQQSGIDYIKALAIDENANPQMRLGAIQSMLIIPNEQFKPAVWHNLDNSKDMTVRVISMMALKAIGGNEDDLDKLTLIIENPEEQPNIRQTARQVYNAIAGREVYPENE
ncbi:MAG: HEAT repeat domain-containing protein [Planctomycetes bacterium]|nr:HEAT repeat domain-containing protein [Planctomycetota bacterium]